MVAARHLHWAHHDLATLGFGSFLGLGNGRHAEIIAPVRMLILVHHAGDSTEANAMMVEETVFSVFAHVHELVAGPAELLAVEAPSRDGIARRQFVPGTAAILAWREDRARLVLAALRRDRLHHIEWRALRVGNHGDPADIGDIGCRHQSFPAGLLDRFDRLVDIRDVNVAEPGRTGTMLLHFSVERQHAAGEAAVCADHAVAIVGFFGLADVPADNRVIEGL